MKRRSCLLRSRPALTFRASHRQRTEVSGSLWYARRRLPEPGSHRLPGPVRFGYTSSELTGTDPNQPLAARSTPIELSQERYLRVSSDVDGDRWAG